MDDRDGVLVCRATNLNLSERASAELRAILERSSPGDLGASGSNVRWGVEWFCPADAQRLCEVDVSLICTACDRVLPGRLVYALIELNWHPTPPDRERFLRVFFEAWPQCDIDESDIAREMSLEWVQCDGGWEIGVHLLGHQTSLGIDPYEPAGAIDAVVDGLAMLLAENAEDDRWYRGGWREWRGDDGEPGA